MPQTVSRDPGLTGRILDVLSNASRVPGFIGTMDAAARAYNMASQQGYDLWSLLSSQAQNLAPGPGEALPLLAGVRPSLGTSQMWTNLARNERYTDPALKLRRSNIVDVTGDYDLGQRTQRTIALIPHMDPMRPPGVVLESVRESGQKMGMPVTLEYTPGKEHLSGQAYVEAVKPDRGKIRIHPRVRYSHANLGDAAKTRKPFVRTDRSGALHEVGHVKAEYGAAPNDLIGMLENAAVMGENALTMIDERFPLGLSDPRSPVERGMGLLRQGLREVLHQGPHGVDDNLYQELMAHGHDWNIVKTKVPGVTVEAMRQQFDPQGWLHSYLRLAKNPKIKEAVGLIEGQARERATRQLRARGSTVTAEEILAGRKLQRQQAGATPKATKEWEKKRGPQGVPY